jgi:hypothetical protein
MDGDGDLDIMAVAWLPEELKPANVDRMDLDSAFGTMPPNSRQPASHWLSILWNRRKH